MRFHTLLALLALSAASFPLHAAAPLPATANSDASALLAGARHDATATEACLARASGDRVAQINCCSGHKGVCGCRAGKIICCDGTASTEPGCTCHGDEGITE